MQSFHEAKGLQPRELAGHRVPALALQTGDGENGGVMMNEFPSAYKRVWPEIGTEGVVGLNGPEYLGLLTDCAREICRRGMEILQHDF